MVSSAFLGLLHLLRLSGYLKGNLLSCDIAQLEAEAAKKLIFSLSLFRLVGWLLVDGLGVFVDNLYQLDKLVENVGYFHDFLLLVRRGPGLSYTIKQAEVIRNRVENETQKYDSEDGIFQERLLSLLSVAVTDVTEDFDVLVQSRLFELLLALELAFRGFCLSVGIILGKYMGIISR